MKRIAKYILTIPLLSVGIGLNSCSSEMEDLIVSKPLGPSDTIEVTVEEQTVPGVATRTIPYSWDRWVGQSFSYGDQLGLYALTGGENFEEKDVFDQPIENKKMDYAGGSGAVFRFSTADGSTIDTEGVYSMPCMLYYPYYEDMPDPSASSGVGMPLRVVDPKDGIVKMVDYKYSEIVESNGVKVPTFYHGCAMMVFQRGEGFKNAKDKRIFVVMKDPVTDVRILQSGTSAYSGGNFQYNPVETGDDLYIELPTKNKVNKYRVWESWEGGTYENIASSYAYVPPGTCYYIVAQDDYGTWQNMTDFSLYGTNNKTTYRKERYILTLKLVGLKAVVRPVSVEPWGDETIITDDRKMGITDHKEYNDWVSEYNAYISEGRNPAREEKLKQYGEGVYNTATGQTRWTFFINSDITFTNEFYKINRLEDALECSSTYANYKLNNIKGTLIGELAAGGSIKAFDFRDIYLVQDDSASTPFSVIADVLDGGTISDCNIINGILISSNEVGMLAGTVKGGTVSGCTVSGDIIGKSTASVGQGMFGIVQSNPTLTNNMTSGLKFIQN